MLQIALQRLPLFLLIALLAACSTTRVGSGTKSSNSSKVITQLEYNQWAGDIVISITPRLQAALTAPGRVRTGPVVLAMGDFKDKTAQAGANFTVTKDTLYGQVRKQLVNTGLVAISMDIAGQGGGDVDSLLQQIDSLRPSGEYDQGSTVRAGQAQAPEFILWGSILSIKFEGEGAFDRSINYHYAFDVRLIDTRTRLTVFEEQVQLAKQFDPGLFGK